MYRVRVYFSHVFGIYFPNKKLIKKKEKKRKTKNFYIKYVYIVGENSIKSGSDKRLKYI